MYLSVLHLFSFRLSELSTEPGGGQGKAPPPRARSPPCTPTSELFFHNLNQHSSPANWISVKPCDLCANPHSGSPCAKLPAGRGATMDMRSRSLHSWCQSARRRRRGRSVAPRLLGTATAALGYCTPGSRALHPRVPRIAPPGPEHCTPGSRALHLQLSSRKITPAMGKTAKS